MPQPRIPPSTPLRLPIFIVGTPRSGTTLLRLLLINHPDIAIPDETNIMDWLYKKPGKRRLLLPRASDAGNLTTAFGMNLAAEYDSLKRHKRPRSRRDKVAWFFERYAHQRGKQYWGDKTPGHAPYASELKDLFPESTFVFMLRDPRAVVASLLRYKGSSLRTERDFWICDRLEEASRAIGATSVPGSTLRSTWSLSAMKTSSPTRLALWHRYPGSSGSSSLLRCLRPEGHRRASSSRARVRKAEPFRNGKRAQLERSIPRWPTTGGTS